MGDEKTCPFDLRCEDGSIFFKGKITSRAAPLLMDAYHRSGTEDPIILDFSSMEHIDISGINALIKLSLRARRHGKKIVAYGLSPYFREVFTATRIDQAIFVESSDFAETSTDFSWKGSPWARSVKRLALSHVPKDAINLNVEGLRAVGPVQGFGRLWEKTYTVRLGGIVTTPQEVIRTLKENFPGFQPKGNRFYPTPSGIVPGEIVIINASTPLGLICTGVWVVYADDETFTFMTPQGHPESGWVTFSAYEDQGAIVAQVQGFARANDPIYELGFVLAGSKVQEKIWTHVLASLASYLGADGWVDMSKRCVDPGYQWDQIKNIWYNAQIRSTMYLLKRLIFRKKGAGR